MTTSGNLYRAWHDTQYTHIFVLRNSLFCRRGATGSTGTGPRIASVYGRYAEERTVRELLRSYRN